VYGDGPAREARPTSAGGNNLTVGGPYEDTPTAAPTASAPGAAFGAAATRQGAAR